METIVIKPVTLDDLDQLRKISRQTFLQAFSSHNSAGNMDRYLAERFSIEQLTVEVQNQGSRFYFALLHNQVIGYLKINLGDSQTEIKDNKGLEIERIYVLNEYHGKNVGQVLYELAVQIAREKNATYVWLAVWEENHRAISFYRKNGFVEFDQHIFKLGDDEQTDIMMKKKLID